MTKIKQDPFLGQVERWRDARVKFGSQKKISFKALYQDYNVWVLRNTNECVLTRGSFAHYFYKTFDNLFTSGQIRKLKGHPITFENLALEES